MRNEKLLETLADISYSAGFNRFYTGDSRSDVKLYIFWAKEFEKEHAHTDWNETDYIMAIDDFVGLKLKEAKRIYLEYIG